MVKEKDLKRVKSSISKAISYKEIGDFWDNHDLSDFWNFTEPVEIDVDIQSEETYYALDNQLSDLIRETARKRGVSANTLINLIIQEKLLKEKHAEKI